MKNYKKQFQYARILLIINKAEASINDSLVKLNAFLDRFNEGKDVKKATLLLAQAIDNFLKTRKRLETLRRLIQKKPLKIPTAGTSRKFFK